MLEGSISIEGGQLIEAHWSRTRVCRGGLRLRHHSLRGSRAVVAAKETSTQENTEGQGQQDCRESRCRASHGHRSTCLTRGSRGLGRGRRLPLEGLKRDVGLQFGGRSALGRPA